jgi:hypothetical protein
LFGIFELINNLTVVDGSFIKLHVHLQEATVPRLIVLLNDIIEEAVLLLFVLNGEDIRVDIVIIAS